LAFSRIGSSLVSVIVPRPELKLMITGPLAAFAWVSAQRNVPLAVVSALLVTVNVVVVIAGVATVPELVPPTPVARLSLFMTTALWGAAVLTVLLMERTGAIAAGLGLLFAVTPGVRGALAPL
jgi:hypothetical protein